MGDGTEMELLFFTGDLAVVLSVFSVCVSAVRDLGLAVGLAVRSVSRTSAAAAAGSGAAV
ncbi:MAG: hypothetical protein JWM52_664 [Candidatus Saccharibacteria bacterium]|nr:hypothetical protein [Candidatus Saccharibacteria bacterium]